MSWVTEGAVYIKLISRLAYLCLALPLVALAQSTATVTILEGEAALLRGTTRYVLLEGVRLAPGDIVQTGDKTFARVEFADGSRADLGGKTRFLNAVARLSRRAKAGGTSDHFLLSGLMKFSGGKSANASYRYATPQFTVATSESVAVVQLAETEASVFVESGEVRLVEIGPKGASAPQRLNGGEFYTRRNTQKSAIAPRPSQTFIGALPRGFLDTIPSRLSRFKDREIAPKRAEEIIYTDIEPWLKTNRDVRRHLVQRWRSRASDPAFRSALIANLKDHPEWDPILFPEKYKPKEEKAPAAAPKGADVR
ncbi:MAG: hypothetical protein A3F74_22400 [Betaproteobacteria bacterium RIFCSPLOWO2_12_FULL_62_58]|nr:MAG: hypothetical protein A3F74_22400 [Betaproteobacteria bacterium RIFCSPLOWO2_12_FULL_62_58]